MVTFEAARETWRLAALKAANARVIHELAHGQALLGSAAKSAEGRKAEADASTVTTRADAVHAELDARAAYHLMLMIHLRDGLEPGREER